MRGVVASIPLSLVVIGGCEPSVVGTPCTPSQEFDQTFLGFDPGELTIDATSDPNVVCLVSHFRGRTTCPYGQDKSASALPTIDGASGGAFPEGVGPCLTPDGLPVTGDPIGDPVDLAQVEPQCTDRTPARAVYLSCKCGNASGRTDDGGHYCSCPSGTHCTNLAGPACIDCELDFCVLDGTVYDPSASCFAACDPRATTCP